MADHGRLYGTTPPSLGTARSANNSLRNAAPEDDFPMFFCVVLLVPCGPYCTLRCFDTLKFGRVAGAASMHSESGRLPRRLGTPSTPSAMLR